MVVAEKSIIISRGLILIGVLLVRRNSRPEG
jgi:hypothetical protein